MAKNLVREGGTIIYVQNTTGAAKTSGQLVALESGNILALLMNDAADDGFSAAYIAGEIKYTKLGGTAWVQGDTLYFDATEDRLTKVSTGNKRAGIASEAATSAAVLGKCLLNMHIGDPGT